MFAYTVCVTFQNSTLAKDWLDWLRNGHIQEVIECGASDAEIVKLDGAENSFEIRYHFASRESFGEYERDHAPRLRAEGLAKFPVEKGVAYKRTTGDVIEIP